MYNAHAFIVAFVRKEVIEKMDYMIGVDMGTTSVKTVLFDQNGKEIAQMAQEYPVYQPHNGWSEQDPEDWYSAAIATMRYVIEESGVPTEAIKGIGMSGQMMGAVMCQLPRSTNQAQMSGVPEQSRLTPMESGAL